MEPNDDFLQMLENSTIVRLSKPDESGVQKVIPGDLITALTGIFTQFVSSCLSSGQTQEAVSARVSKPGSYERAAFRRKFIDQEFDGSGKAYRKAGGDSLLNEFFAIHKDATNEQVTGIVKQIADKGHQHIMI